ncbi:tetratricopeptide repeat protein [Micromonospora sp. HNM0581]|uniref:tetratricopeptide repeat protein n=1 Tax=Micromonospora sp. HNM0581 TaxID=2716341 RepID=UPI00146F1071|nr:tetratricopeptide repeat protein [Micromonospora sp. HNM0581]NLU77327.1 tetratricopeptide repeat protein [Micromonospora sp. HNM0581]
MSADAPTDPPAAEGYLERATLLAELGRYDEAVAELGYALALDPAAAAVSTLLARVHLAAGRPDEALTAAEAAVAAAAGQVPPLVVRGLALSDLERYAEAARTADEILALGPEDAYAQRSAAAILAGSRNGQPALNAAWHAVELAPEEPQGHLVLGLVAANMRMYDLAERAYREALRLDPRLTEIDDVGVLRLEQRRWSSALERLAEAAVANLPPTDPRRADEMPDETTRPDGAGDDRDRPGAAPDGSGRSTAGHLDEGGSADGQEEHPGWPAQRADAPVGAGDPGLAGRGDGSPGQSDVGPVAARQPVPVALRQLVLWGAGWSLVAAVVVACSTATGTGFSRLLAVVAAAGGGVVFWQHASRLPGLTRTVLPVLRRTDRPLALAVYAAAAAPVLILLYALFGTAWPLVLAIAVATAARLAIVGRPVA